MTIGLQLQLLQLWLWLQPWLLWLWLWLWLWLRVQLLLLLLLLLLWLHRSAPHSALLPRRCTTEAFVGAQNGLQSTQHQRFSP